VSLSLGVENPGRSQGNHKTPTIRTGKKNGNLAEQPLELDDPVIIIQSTNVC
jgi:hypothetical protein